MEKEIYEKVLQKLLEEDELQEFSGVGAVGGFAAPIGYINKSSKTKNRRKKRTKLKTVTDHLKSQFVEKSFFIFECKNKTNKL